MEEDEIRAVVSRLSRPLAAGGSSIERAAILAEGTDAGAIIAWIGAHAGIPEAGQPPEAPRGLHG